MIQAEGKAGTSRIVAHLDAPTVSIPRADADMIVTEFGVADLRDQPVQARMAAMAMLAPPAHRDALLAAAKA
jgi:acyl-CoA hydrolase